MDNNRFQFEGTPKKATGFLKVKQEKDRSISSPQEDPQVVTKYCKMYLKFITTHRQVQQALEQVQQLRDRLAQAQGFQVAIDSKVKKNEEDELKEEDMIKKRKRRAADQIARHFVCKIKNCQKSYGSQGSLNQHYKFKHPSLYKSLIIDSQINSCSLISSQCEPNS